MSLQLWQSYQNIYGTPLTEEDNLIMNYLLENGYTSNENDSLKILYYMSEEWYSSILNEMRKADKEAGKKSGGSSDPAFRAVARLKREMEGGRPEGQQKKIRGQKDEYRSSWSPAEKLAKRRKARAEGEKNQSSRFD